MALSISANNLILQTGCVSVMEPFQNQSMDRAKVGLIPKEFHGIKLPDRQVILRKISRICNSVVGELC